MVQLYFLFTQAWTNQNLGSHHLIKKTVAESRQWLKQPLLMHSLKTFFAGSQVRTYKYIYTYWQILNFKVAQHVKNKMQINMLMNKFNFFRN